MIIDNVIVSGMIVLPERRKTDALQICVEQPSVAVVQKIDFPAITFATTNNTRMA